MQKKLTFCLCFGKPSSLQSEREDDTDETRLNREGEGRFETRQQPTRPSEARQP